MGVKRADLLTPFPEKPLKTSELPAGVQRSLKTISSLSAMQKVMSSHQIN